MYRLLLVEDEKRMHEILVDYFFTKQCQIICVDNGVEALRIIEEQQFDLIILDVMMPGIDGFTVCRQIRKKLDVPVIFLTARGNEDDQINGYKLGADDYVTKPFSLGVLYAKANSLIKRANGTVVEEKLISNEVCVDIKRYKVTVANEEVKLAPKEYEILVYLIQNKNQIITREQLLIRLWGYDYEGNDRVIDTHMKKLRKALGNAANYIHTIVKVGYKWRENDGHKY